MIYVAAFLEDSTCNVVDVWKTGAIVSLVGVQV